MSQRQQLKDMNSVIKKKYLLVFKLLVKIKISNCTL